jgi:hypothetical protein
MIASLLRLVALRPILGMAILGIPVITLILLGIAFVFIAKLFVFVVLPIAIVVWLYRKLTRSRSSSAA